MPSRKEKRFMNISYFIIGIIILLGILLFTFTHLNLKHAVSATIAIIGVLCILLGIYLFSATAWRNISIGSFCLGIVLIVISIALYIKKK